jgi:hypothetical protein
MTFAAKDGPSNLRLKGDLVMLPAVVTDDLESFRNVVALSNFSRAALCAALRGHHVALVKDLLFLFSEKEGLFALHARCFDVRHKFAPYKVYLRVMMRVILAQSGTLTASVIRVRGARRDFSPSRQASSSYSRLQDRTQRVLRTRHPPTASPSPSSQ